MGKEAIYKFAKCDSQPSGPESMYCPSKKISQYTLDRWGHQSNTSNEWPSSTSGDPQTAGPAHHHSRCHQLRAEEPDMIIWVDQ